MTTKVTVETNHGWPVRVSAIDPKTGNAIVPDVTIPPNETRQLHLHSGLDLHFHEVQPNEIETPSPAGANFLLGTQVTLARSGEAGEIIAIGYYARRSTLYLVEYVNGCGCQQEVWLEAEAIAE